MIADAISVSRIRRVLDRRIRHWQREHRRRRSGAIDIVRELQAVRAGLTGKSLRRYQQQPRLFPVGTAHHGDHDGNRNRAAKRKIYVPAAGPAEALAE